MKRLILTAAMLAALAACGDNGQTGPSPDTAARAPAKAAPDAADGLRVPFPAGAEVGFPYRVKYDREQAGEAGPERQVSLAYGDSTATRIADRVEASMDRAGFKLGKRASRPDGAIRMTFRMKRYGNAFVVVTPASEREGRVVYRWVPDGK